MIESPAWEQFCAPILSQTAYRLTDAASSPNGPVLPYWLEVVKALAPLFAAVATLVIGLIAGYIAWKQWETNRNKLKLDRFERRLAVYEAAGTLIGHVIAQARPTDEAMFKFLDDTRLAVWLFDEDFAEYLESLYSNASVLASLLAPSEALYGKPEAKAQQSEERKRLRQWFLAQGDELKRRAKPFLKISH
ncbi:hypothetical protein [Cupriavidus nantongensis]|uniref:Uncharacterized protein n=1 Tax=Cupriavidus nantongensis TaxID=1796606 RepID=A0A142JGP7_9BURK|nr:hypothetical protein [Cupriavidus nantongensis]AMR77259.1 hypothetical protein A2G96_05670 [Cupriavidus nantongensis]